MADDAQTPHPGNEPQRSAQERWRERTRSAGRPEVDAVDSAVTAAVAVFADTVKSKPPTSAGRQRAEAIERMAVDYLVALGRIREEAARMVHKRLHRLDVKRLSKLIGDVEKEVSRVPVTT